jgi:hypothetical protein
MFSFFKKEAASEFPDKVWKNRDILWKEITTEALRILKRSETPVIVCFFPATQLQFNSYLQSLNVPYKQIGAGYVLTENTVYTIDAHSLESDQVLGGLQQRNRISKVSFLFLGRYPLIQREAKVTQKIIASMGNDLPVSFWLSFDDPLLKKFGAAKVLPLLEKLGVKDDECIEHSMVSKSIANARKKIGEKVRSEITADSEEQWFERNVG